MLRLVVARGERTVCRLGRDALAPRTLSPGLQIHSTGLLATQEGGSAAGSIGLKPDNLFSFADVRRLDGALPS